MDEFLFGELSADRTSGSRMAKKIENTDFVPYFPSSRFALDLFQLCIGLVSNTETLY